MPFKQKPYRSNNQTSRKKLIILCVVGLLLIGGIGAALYMRRDDKPAPLANPDINLAPATAQDQAESDQRKEDIVKQDEANKTPQTGARQVTPTIVDAGQYEGKIEVRAFVAGVAEDDGTCTMTFTHDSQKVTKDVVGFADATTTKCTNLSIDQGQLPSKGTWSVVVSYKSATANGSSTAATFEVK